MRWFKHMTASADDEKIAQLMSKTGLEGYGFWWRVVEIVAGKVGGDNETSVTFPARKWGNLLNSAGQVQKTGGNMSELRAFRACPFRKRHHGKHTQHPEIP